MTGPMALTVGSLCSGFEATGLGLHLAGWDHTLAFVADPDPAAGKALAHHHPTVPNLGDITTVDWTAVPKVDLLHMGFPCTDVSAAGRREGLAAGTRSGVWAHCAQAIGQLRPPLVLIENVPGLLSTPANRSTDARPDRNLEPGPANVGVAATGPVLRAVGAVLGDLASIGYDTVRVCVSAADVGAPHLRRRIFIFAWPAADPVGVGLRLQSVTQPRRSGTAVAGDAGADRGTGLTLLPTPTARDGDGRGEGSPEYWANRRDEDGRANGMPLGAAVNLLPTPRAPDGTKGGGPNRAGSSGDLMLPSAVQPDRFGDYGPAIARWEQVLGRPAPDPTEAGTKGQPRLSARFVEWMQGLPDGYVTNIPGISRNDALRLLGNSNPPQQYAAAITQLAAIVAQVLTSERAA